MLRLRNLETNREIIFDSKNYVINHKDLGVSKAAHTSFKGINQIGEYLTNSTLGSRDISLTGYILADSAENMRIKKRELYKLLNPLDRFVLVYNNFKLDCVAESTIKFSSKTIENNDSIAKFIISAYCPNPCFVPVHETRVNLAMWKGNFHFPLAIPSTGIIMGQRTPSTIVNVNNNGDISTGIILEFIAKGEVVNPSLFNVNTRQFIKLNKTMAAGEIIKVNTNYGEKSVVSIYGGTTENALMYWDLDSTFLQLDVGDNILRYDAETNLNNLEINVFYYPKFLGV